MSHVSVIIPAYNEAGAVGLTVEILRRTFQNSGHDCEVIVVDDGSTDGTADEAEEAGAIVLRHGCNIGYGNSILTGISHARYDVIALTDADGTYPLGELPGMVDALERRGLDMLVGARQGRHYRGSPTKYLARRFFKWLAEFTTGTRIPDINSGLRVFRRDLVEHYSPVLCGGFSFTTSLTVLALLTHRFVAYQPIAYHRRSGSSKVHHLRDSLRAAQVLVMTILIFNPIKLYILLASLLGAATLPAVLVAAIWPSLGMLVLVSSLIVLTVGHILGLGLLAEQRRASPHGVLSYPRHERELRVRSAAAAQQKADLPCAAYAE